MRAPAQLSRITLDDQPGSRRFHSFPPVGFLAFSEAQPGNGDSFGLYWPIGREQQEPLVAEAWHDDWLVQPTYSSLDRFLVALDRGDEEHPEPLSLDEDPDSPRMCLEQAKTLVAANALEKGRELLERSVRLLPEYTDALTLLWSVYIRTKRADQAAEIAIRAVISPPCFGLRAFKPLRWLRSANVSDEHLEDPIWKRRKELSLEFGGTKHNQNYPLMREAIDEYLAMARYERAITLMQTYAEFMYSETTAFQERYGYDRDKFMAWQIEVSSKLPGGPRNVM